VLTDHSPPAANAMLSTIETLVHSIAEQPARRTGEE
jgi:hypothetical protein